VSAGSASTRSIRGGRAAPEWANWSSGTPASTPVWKIVGRNRTLSA
jgi:hypothetical protein